MDESITMAAAPIQADTLVPLHDLGADIWKTGFRGEILYCPIKDYGVLPDDVLDDLVSKIIYRLNCGQKAGLFCQGGHGRTGYVASIVLGKLGYEDPIQFLRSNYCRNAVESDIQVQHIAEVLEKPELAQKYAVQDIFGDFDDYWFDFYSRYDLGFNAFATRSEISVCGKCARYIAGKCQKFNVFVDKDDWACDEFSERLT
jgi:hypothetical protein